MDAGMDTIAAQATASGEGGIAIVRISGPRAEAILRTIFCPAGNGTLINRVLTFGRLMENGQVFDEAMAVLMRAPHSYTREDVAEIQCHGSDALVRRILMLLVQNGARMARPGEFTYRAFLNGRIDLAQAEAVMRMIRADSERAMDAAIRQMEGGVSAFVSRARQEIIGLLADLSAAIDFPDEVEETQTVGQIRAACKAIGARLLAGCDPRAGRIVEEGLRVVLCGLPNAGKSSLLNAMVGGERAIVTEIAGTTRDTLSESIQIQGYRVILTDTAGLRATEDTVEQIGVERARRAIADADVRVLVIDGSSEFLSDEISQLDGMKPDLIVVSKSDLPMAIRLEALRAAFDDVPVLSVCAPKGEGMEALFERLLSFASPSGGETAVLSQARHVEAATHACAALEDAQHALDAGMPLDVCAVDLSAALEALGEITGETLNEQVIDEVFAKFCVGK